MKRRRNDDSPTSSQGATGSPSEMSTQDTWSTNGILSQLGSLIGNIQTPAASQQQCENALEGCNAINAAYTAQGAAWAAGGNGAPVGSVLQNTIGPAGGSVETRTFRACGSFFVSDEGSHNTWCNFPYEFPRLFVKDRDLYKCMVEYDMWRTKRISFKLKQPIQRYTYTSATGTTMTAADMAARLLVFTDTERHLGIPLNPGWTQLQANAFINQIGGFRKATNTTWELPVKLDLDSPVGLAGLDDPINDFAPGVEQLSCNVASETQRHYFTSDKTWRHMDEMACPQTIWENKYIAGENTALPRPNMTVVDTCAALVTRGDNVSCLKVCPAAAKLPSSVGSQALTYTAPWLAQATQWDGGDQTNISRFDHQPTFGHVKLDANDNKWNMTWPECIEEHPAPQVWISYRNIVGVDGSSIMNQKVQVDFEYEWEVEFNGSTRTYMMGSNFFGPLDAKFTYSATRTEAEWNALYRGPWSYRKKARNALQYRWYAIPFYLPHLTTAGDGAYQANTAPTIDKLRTPQRLFTKSISNTQPL